MIDPIKVTLKIKVICINLIINLRGCLTTVLFIMQISQFINNMIILWTRRVIFSQACKATLACNSLPDFYSNNLSFINKKTSFLDKKYSEVIQMKNN